MSLAAWIGEWVRKVVRDYRLNWIYASSSRIATVQLPAGLAVRPSTTADLDRFAASPDVQARKVVGYAAQSAAAFVLANVDDTPLGIAHFVVRNRYTHASIWPLCEDQIALIDIVIVPEARGRGHAAQLIAIATPLALASVSREEAICFIWWTHRASLRAFRRAGWRTIGFSVELVRRGGQVHQIRVPLRGRMTA